MMRRGLSAAMLVAATSVATMLAMPWLARADEAAEESQAPPAEPEPQPQSDALAWSLRLSADVGVGSRSFGVPMDGVVYGTDTGLFPLAGLGFELDHLASRDFSVGLLARYQTSIGLGIVELHTDGSEHPLDVRAKRLELALTPTLRLDAEGRWALCVAAGYGILGFRPVGHLNTPGFSLDGPALRVQLQVPLVGELLRLRLGPEAQWVAHVGQELVDRGVDSHGWGLGGEAGLELTLGQHWAVHAVYREQWSLIGSSQGQTFEDTARFVTARLSGSL